MTPQVVLKAHKVRTFATRHPWVLDASIDRIVGQPADGDEVELLSDKGKFLGRGLYNGHSRIRVRLYSGRQNQPLDAAFWRARLASAVALRRLLGYDEPAGACRLVCSEGDGLSGLVVDRYAGWLVVQVTALAIQKRLDVLVPLLAELVQPRGILFRTDRIMARAEKMEVRDGLAWGEPPPPRIPIVDGGLHWEVDLVEGQKTGIYLDQRENRRVAARYMAGRRVLDMFCYQGGFSLAARAWGQAAECLGYDSSEKAVAEARAAACRNGLSQVRFETGEAFQTLQALYERKERFGAVVLDPPKFARGRKTLDEALRAYHWLNRLAMAVLEPEGILVTCSCSGHVSRQDFFDVLVGAAQQSGRDVQVLEQRGASPDHPVALNCPESEYLKCFICRVH